MSIRRYAVVRALGVTLAVAAGLAAGAPSASADGTATMSNVRSSDGHVTGSMVLRGIDPATVDLAGMTARVGTLGANVKVTPASGGARSTMLVIDTSGSMEASGMATVRAAVRDFLAGVPDDVKVGVVSFASTAGVDVKPTTDHAKVQKAVNGLRARGETSLYDGVRKAVSALGTEGERSIILLSDGDDTVAAKSGGAARDASQRKAAIAALTKGKVRAEVIAFKGGAGDVLAAFAKAGGGSVTSAADKQGAQRAFTAAAKALESQLTFDITLPAGATGTREVFVEGTAAGSPFSVGQAVVLDAAAPVVEVAQETPDGAGLVVGEAPIARTAATSGWFLWASLGALALGAFIVVLTFFGPAFRSKRSERVAEIDHYGLGVARPESAQRGGTAVLSEQILQVGDRVMSGRESTTKTVQLLERADLPWRAGEWWVIRVISVIVAVVVAVLFINGSFLTSLAGVLIGLVVGFLLPTLVLRFLAKRRSRKFEAVLPDVMMLVATSLSSGFSLLQALDSVARDAPEPAAKEFSRALAESRIGSDISDALEHAAERMESENMRWAVMAIRIQREVGGNLADTLRTTAATLREREQLKRHVRALSAEGRLSAYILIALPIGIFVYSTFTNYEYVSLLWTRTLGWIMLAGGIVSMIIGIFWMRKTVQIEV